MTGVLATPPSATAARARPVLAITGIGVACRGADGPATADRDVPDGGPWFDVKTALGPRGYKYLPAACQYLIAASRRALAHAGETGEGDPSTQGAPATDPERRAAAVGTNSAAAALHDRMDRTVIDGDAEDLSPATAPFFSINLFVSRLATEHRLRSFNLTLTSPRIAGLESLEIGARSVALGRADLLLAGATEAPLPDDDAGATDSEDGAVVLVAEPVAAARARGATVRGTCRVRTLFLPPSRLATRRGRDDAATAVGDALAALTGGTAVGARAVVDDSAAGEAVTAALAAAGAGPRVHAAGVGSLAPLRHVAALIATDDTEQVVAVAAAEGHVALAHLCPATPRSTPPRHDSRLRR